MNADIKNQLRKSYDASAAEREIAAKAQWKLDERQAFSDLLKHEGLKTLLEIGAGSGQDSLFFQEQGFHVIATDLSPNMVQFCREKGLEAYEMDFQNLDFPDNHFDAVYALNCLLHVPKSDLSVVLEEIQRVLKIGGLFFLGLYGGFDQEGIWKDDHHNPKRFFVFYNDYKIQEIVTRFFKLEDFKRIIIPDLSREELVFQRLILRKE